jgi:hypothetical protein
MEKIVPPDPESVADYEDRYACNEVTSQDLQ